MTQQQVIQRTGGQGQTPEHRHGLEVHTHDHYHVSHHHEDNIVTEWSHRTYWHTHEHNHNELVHTHDYVEADERFTHGKEAHIHDHSDPACSPG